MRNLAKDVYGDIVPQAWLKYVVSAMGLNEWIIDFKKRLDQFQHLAETPLY